MGTGYGVAAAAQQALVVPVLAVGTAAGTTFLLSTSSLQARRAMPHWSRRPLPRAEVPCPSRLSLRVLVYTHCLFACQSDAV